MSWLSQRCGEACRKFQRCCIEMRLLPSLLGACEWHTIMKPYACQQDSKCSTVWNGALLTMVCEHNKMICQCVCRKIKIQRDAIPDETLKTTTPTCPCHRQAHTCDKIRSPHSTFLLLLSYSTAHTRSPRRAMTCSILHRELINILLLVYPALFLPGNRNRAILIPAESPCRCLPRHKP